MAINAARMAGEWFGPLSRKDRTSRLIEKIKVERSPEMRIRAVQELGMSGDHNAVGSLVECCRDQDPEIRRGAIMGLQTLRSGHGVSALIERLQDKEERLETRQRAAAALAAIRSYRAMQELRTRYADQDENNALRFFIGGELDRVQNLVSANLGPVSLS